MMKDFKDMDKSELMDVVDTMKGMMGTDDLLLALTKAMSSADLQDLLEYIDRVYDLNVLTNPEA